MRRGKGANEGVESEKGVGKAVEGKREGRRVNE